MTGNNNDTTLGGRSAGAKVTPMPRGERDLGLGDQHLERLATSFELSARRWELIVYPALIAFIVLAGYGFYLIYNLTRDVGSLSRNVASLTTSINSMAGNMNNISSKMDSLPVMRDNMVAMNQSMQAMDHNTRYMAVNMELINHNVGAMNYNIGRPMGAVNSFMPW